MNRQSRKSTCSRFRTLTFHQLEQRRVMHGAGLGHWEIDAPLFHAAPPKPAFEGEVIAAQVGSLNTLSPGWFDTSEKIEAPRVLRVEYIIYGHRFQFFELIGEGEPHDPKLGEPDSHRSVPDKVPDQVPDQLTIPVRDTTGSSHGNTAQSNPTATVNPAPISNTPITKDTISTNSSSNTSPRPAPSSPLTANLNSVAVGGAPFVNPVNNVVRQELSNRVANVVFTNGPAGSSVSVSNAPISNAGTSQAFGLANGNASSSSQSRYSDLPQFNRGRSFHPMSGITADIEYVKPSSSKVQSGTVFQPFDGTMESWSDLAFERVQAWSDDALSVTHAMVDSGTSAGEPTVRVAWSLWVAAGACLGVAVLESWIQSRKKQDDRLSVQGMWLVGVQPKLPPIR